MEQAINAYHKVTASPEFQELERIREKARHDEAQALHHAQMVGRDKERTDVALRMLAEGEPIHKIARYTGLSVSELKKYQ